MHDRQYFHPLGWVIMLLMLAGAARAADVYQNVDGNNGNWDTATYWVPQTPNAAGNVYWVGTMPDGVTAPPGYLSSVNSRIRIRTPNTAAATFLGDRLIINGTSSSLVLRPTTNGTMTIPDLRMRGDNPLISTQNGLLHLAGTMTLETIPGEYVSIQVNSGTAQRHCILDAKVTGNGGIRAEGANVAMDTVDSAVEFNNNNNDFTGFVTGYRNSKIIVNQPKGLGNITTLTIGNNSQLIFNASPIAMGSTNLVLNTGSKFTVSQPSYTFRSIRLPGNTQVPAGTYTVAQLLPLSTVFADGGGGSVIVTTGMPELGVPREADGTITTCTFGSVNPWLPAPTATVTVTNIGSQPLNFMPRYDEYAPANPGVVLQNNPTTATIYSIQSVAPSSSLPLAPGGTLTITLRFNCTVADYDPGTSGTLTNLKPGTLRLYTNGVNGNIGIPLRGTTVPVEVSKFTID